MKRFNQRTGASLIEILVVIVIFLVGILAIAQIFPGGLNILRTTRNNTMATALARAEMERLKSQIDQLADAIVPARYVWNGTRYVIDYDLNRYPNDFSPAGAIGTIPAIGRSSRWAARSDSAPPRELPTTITPSPPAASLACSMAAATSASH